MNDFQSFWLFLLGASFGGVVAGVIVSRIRKSGKEKNLQGQSMSDASAELLEVLSASAVVLNPSNVAVRATQAAMVMGLLRVRSLRHPELLALVERARESNGIESADVELSTGLRGANIFVNARATNLGDSNVLLLVEDRTEARRLDETRRDFIANISHELKTPIGAISLLSEAIKDAEGDPVMLEKFTKSLRKEAKRLAALVNDVIQLSRYQSVEMQSHVEMVDLAAVVEEAVERNSFKAEQKNIKINFLAPSGITVVGDQEMLIVALKNLIENAVIYSEENDTVGVGLRVNDDVAEIAVTDNGVGLDAEEQNRVFERFYRVDPSRSRETGGTGLGLSIVKHVALSHNGEVRVFSKPGVGSTFTLRLPLADKHIVVNESDRTKA
ncbi:MAG: two-component sensor histidine kinase [Microbacteriaceae bacterium]|nr:two-component sensor histidine kinase [Microbacteriaceae bacterium]